ncbi:hypothetical protein BDV93DRAFT_232516 [Ceratobasidium sp. AG-I]|nr:hypothetical protein BDV93DRAFT_232516 [Ceratobasidium sp. AG-I]
MHQPVLDPMIHQPLLDPISPFRRSSFGIEASLKTAISPSSGAQAFKEMLSQPNRPIPSRRASLRGVSHAPSFPAPPPPPMSVTAQVVDPTRLASMLESHATTMRPPSPIDPARTLAPSRKVHHSPVRSPPPAPPPPPPPPPPTMSSPLRRNSSQAECFMRSNSFSPPSASKRTYSFVRDQSLRPPLAGQHRAPPARSGSCPPDSDILKTRTMRSNSDGYTSASTSFVTEGSTSPTSSSSSNPSDSEDIVDPHRHPHDKKAPEPYTSSFNPAQLELESRRRDLLWRETEKQWKDKHGNTLSRAEDMSFRQKVESNVGQAGDGPQEREWRDMWKTTDSYWNEFEARWRQDLAQRRTASRNDDGHFHTVHSDSRDMTSPDDDNAMTSLMSSFERAMGDKRQAQRLGDLERAERKRREHEHEAWKTTLEHDARRPSSQGPEQERLPDALHRSSDAWAQDRLRRPDAMRTRSSSVIVEGRPNFGRSRSGSVAAVADVLPTDVAVDSPPFETLPRFDEKPSRMKRNRPSRGSKDSFEFLTPELDPLRAAQTELYHADELKQQHLAKARHTLQEELRMSDDSQREEHTRAEKIRRAERREHERRARDLSTEAEPDFRRSNDASQRHRDATSPSPLSAKVPLQPQPSSTEQASPKVDIQEHLLKLEAEQAALARRIQELRMAAEAAASVKSPQAEPDRGPEREHEPERNQNQKVKVGESHPKVQEARKRQGNEADVFKVMQERLRKAGEQKAPERANDFPRKAKRAATLPFLDHGAPVTPTDPRPSLVHSETEPVEGRVHFLPTEQSSNEANRVRLDPALPPPNGRSRARRQQYRCLMCHHT